MSVTAFIAGDWGTTQLRLFLCDERGRRLDSKIGPGARDVRGEFASTFDALTSDWGRQCGPLKAILCGMVGSSIGWAETRYVPSPLDPIQLASACMDLRGGAIRIVPGLSCRNRLGAPDLMRGEETQVLGALQLDPELRRGRQVLCLPGTHTKWVLVEDGSIVEFLTAPTGELYDLICRHSVLVQGGASTGLDPAAFERGLAEFAREPGVQIVHRIFECRSRWMLQDLAAEATASYLSGLMIACDVSGAMKLFADCPAERLLLIGSSRLLGLYSKAFKVLNRETRSLDGETAALAGLAHLHALSVHRGHAT